jgi:hypothetical protein
MKPILLYRIASGLLILFAVSHTMGLFSKLPSTEARVVRTAMNDAHFRFMGSDCTFGQFFIGFGLLFTAYLLFSAFIAFHLGALTQNYPKAIGGLSWAFFLVQVATLALSWIFFFAAPVAVSGLVAVCTGWAAWLVKGAKT